jgi:hypothetical protein
VLGGLTGDDPVRPIFPVIAFRLSLAGEFFPVIAFRLSLAGESVLSRAPLLWALRR